MKTQAKGTLYYPNGKFETRTFEGSMVTLKELQECVDGYIEIIYLENNYLLVVNEEGKMNNLPFNFCATNLAMTNQNGDYVVGNALLIDRKYVD